MNKPLHEYSGWIWMNGEFFEWKKAKIHILSHTLHYGSGVFEGARAYRGQIFKKTQHHQRLHNSAGMLGFNIPYSIDELDKAAENLLKRNKLENAYLRPMAWYGAEELNVASNNNSINVAIAAWEWKSYFKPEVTGLKLMWSDWIRPAPTMAPVHAKANGLYVINTLSKNKAEHHGYDDALMKDYRGYVAECTSSNIFMVKDHVLYTPIADCFLNGITRQTIIELAHSHNIPSDILTADEVFLTGSAIEVQPVIQLGETPFSVGNITTCMMTEYLKLVNGEMAVS